MEEYKCSNDKARKKRRDNRWMGRKRERENRGSERIKERKKIEEKGRNDRRVKGRR